jgi:hypothetical protein
MIGEAYLWSRVLFSVDKECNFIIKGNLVMNMNKTDRKYGKVFWTGCILVSLVCFGGITGCAIQEGGKRACGGASYDKKACVNSDAPCPHCDKAANKKRSCGQ